MMAVTSGYYSETLPETFRYRAEATVRRYQVDVDLASVAADDEFFVDFVGRYLNAARVGKQTLETERAPGAERVRRLRVPDVRATRTSGSPRDGYGLYPYNAPAILRAVQTLADLSGGTRTFNPRRVLARASGTPSATAGP